LVEIPHSGLSNRIKKKMGRYNATIPIDQCIAGHLYIISARNASLGICNPKGNLFDKEVMSFTISRYKFSSNYLFDEVHWDADERYGTACPLLDVGPAPEFASRKDALDWLNAQCGKYDDKIEELDKQQFDWLKTVTAHAVREPCPKCKTPVVIDNGDPRHIQGMVIRQLVCPNPSCDWTEQENKKY